MASLAKSQHRELQGALENPMDRGAWWAIVSLWGRKESDMTEPLRFHFHLTGCRAMGNLAISGGLDLGSALLLTPQFSLSPDLSLPTLETGAVGQCCLQPLSH